MKNTIISAAILSFLLLITNPNKSFGQSYNGAIDDFYACDVNGYTTHSIFFNDLGYSDFDMDSFEFQLLSQPLHGELVFDTITFQSTNTSFLSLDTYTPDLNYIGWDTFYYSMKSYSDTFPDTASVYIKMYDYSFVCKDSLRIEIGSTSCQGSWVPVCGCDGITYSNSCYAEKIGGVYSWIPGECINIINSIDPVWPGDANSDGIANVWDVLPIGIAYNTKGLARLQDNINWMDYLSLTWPSSFNNGLNHKFADCDGNSLVNLNDLTAIIANYGLTHAKNDGEKSVNGIPLFLDITPNTYSAGATVTGTINLGDTAFEAEDIYGLAFSLNYDNSIVEENSMQITFNNSWLAPTNTDVSLSKDFWALNKVDIGHCKTDQVNGSGFGPIASIEFNIQENLAGKSDEVISKLLELSFTDVLAIDNQYQEIDIYGKTDSLYAEQEVGIRDLVQLKVKVFPNPVANELTIQSDSEIKSIRILNVLGQVQTFFDGIDQQNTLIDLRYLETGVYFIQIEGKNNQKANLKVMKN